MALLREAMTMLPDAFLDWWFAPWSYASSTSGPMLYETDLVGRRDAYRLWCSGAGVKPMLPADFDGEWQAAALTDGRVLASGAKLFGGLLAARRQQRDALAQLALADRKWCMSIASVQPLTELSAAFCADDEVLEVRGLTELSCRLEQGFPGMWSRLRLLLSRDLDERVAAQLEQKDNGRDGPDPSSQRALRCWRLCRQRAEEMKQATPQPTNDVSET